MVVGLIEKRDLAERRTQNKTKIGNEKKSKINKIKIITCVWWSWKKGETKW